MFARGERPRAADIAALERENPGFSVSLDPLKVPETDADDSRSAGGEAADSRSDGVYWIELLANGLTFDVAGLAPGEPAPHPPLVHQYDLPREFDGSALEALTLRPGPHLAGGTAMIPVVRSLAWVSAILAGLPGAHAVAWHSARCWTTPQFFRTSVLRWVESGAFPVFSLAALAPTPDGGMQSEGLALFTGQELRVEPDLAEDRAAGARLGLRLMHVLVERGRVGEAETLTGPDGQRLRLEPSPNGRFVRAWKV